MLDLVGVPASARAGRAGPAVHGRAPDLAARRRRGAAAGRGERAMMSRKLPMLDADTANHAVYGGAIALVALLVSALLHRPHPELHAAVVVLLSRRRQRGRTTSLAARPSRPAKSPRTASSGLTCRHPGRRPGHRGRAPAGMTRGSTSPPPLQPWRWASARAGRWPPGAPTRPRPNCSARLQPMQRGASSMPPGRAPVRGGARGRARAHRHHHARGAA